MKHVKTRNRVVREVSDKHTMNIRVLFSLVFLIVITFTVSAQTAVWQWAVPVRNLLNNRKILMPKPIYGYQRNVNT